MTKAITGIGILAGGALLLLGAYLEGSPIMSFFNLPATLIVLGGTFGATLASVGLKPMQAVPGLYRRVLQAEPVDLAGRRDLLVRLSERARRDGLLALDEELGDVDDDFTRKGLQLVVDGTDAELVRDILEGEMDGMASRHATGVRPFDKAGGFSPTMGIIGTVMGLVHVLQQLDQPEKLGPAISGAFMATLYGVGAANVVLMPIANRLKELSREELELRALTIEGILGVQAGENPRVLADKLAAFLPPAERTDAQPDGARAVEPDLAEARPEPLAA